MKISHLTLTLFLLVGNINIAIAATNHKAVITHRQGIYTTMAGHMKVLKSILLMNHPATADINYHANSIRNAALHHGKAFPKGSIKGKTAALPSIWEKPENFKRAGIKFRESLKELIDQSEKKDMAKIKKSFKKVNSSCKGCHDDFRKNK